MQMKSSSKLLAAAGQSSFTESNNNPMAMVPYQGQSVVTSGAYSGTAADTSLVMKQTFESLNARDSSYDGRMGRFGRGPADMSVRSGQGRG